MLDTLNGSIWSETKSAARTVKSTVGKIVRAPGEVAEAVSMTAKGVGKGVSSTAKSVPVILIVAAVGVAGFMILMGKAGKSPVPGIKVGENYPELLGRRRERRRR